MKTTIITLAMLLMAACSVKQKINTADIATTHSELNNAHPAADEQPTIEEIDKELSSMLRGVEDDRGRVCYDDMMAFTKHLEHYLLDPLTYENDMPQLKELMGIFVDPGTGYKFYQAHFYEGGTMGYTCMNYIQYRNGDGKVSFVPFMNDLRYPTSFGFNGFRYNGEAYFLVERYSRGMSCSWYYYVAVISIKDGVITFHPEFFPQELNFEPGIEEYFIYDGSGNIVDDDERPSYFICVCGTETGNPNVGFDFDPETLTFNVRDDADWTESRTGAVVESVWRLQIP